MTEKLDWKVDLLITKLQIKQMIKLKFIKINEMKQDKITGGKVKPKHHGLKKVWLTLSCTDNNQK